MFNSQGEKVVSGQTILFAQHAGGFGGKRTSKEAIPPINAPKRLPDASIKEMTSVDQVKDLLPVKNFEFKNLIIY